MKRHHEPLARRLAWLTTNEIEQLAKDGALVVQPLGAVEQHGPHLPCYTDTLVAVRLTERAIAVTPTSVNVWTLPPLAYGKSNEHLGFAGTIALSTESLIGVCHDIASSLARSEFMKLAFVNGHGGQPQLLETISRDIRERTGLQVFPIFPYRFGLPNGVIDAETELFDIHAGAIETSLVLALEPNAVRVDRLDEAADRRASSLHRRFRYLSLEGAMSTAWLTSDISTSGVIGDPTTASAAKGERLLDHLAQALASLFEEICTFDFGERRLLPN